MSFNKIIERVIIVCLAALVGSASVLVTYATYLILTM